MKHWQVGLKKVAVWRKMLPPQELERLEIHLGNSGGDDEWLEGLQGGDLPGARDVRLLINSRPYLDPLPSSRPYSRVTQLPWSSNVVDG